MNKNELRKCTVNGQNARFHRWGDFGEIVAPSNLRGGHNGGEIRAVMGIVEFEDGTVATVRPERIKFLEDEAE